MRRVIRDLSWWRERTIYKRCVTLIAIFACILVIGSVSVWISPLLRNEISKELKSVLQPSSLPLVIWLTVNPGENDSKPADVCSSKECLNTASEVLDKMNLTIEPCEDFYQFACGKFIEKTDVLLDQKFESSFTMISAKLLQLLKNIITEKIPDTGPKYLRHPNDLYKACMNTNLIENLGTQPIQKVLDSLGKWPVIVGNSWDSHNSWNWQESIKKLRRLGFNRGSLLHISVGVDWRNITKHIINVDQPILNIGGENFFNAPNSGGVFNFYDYVLDYMVDIAVLFGAKSPGVRKELNDTLQFQLDLSHIAEPLSETQNLGKLCNFRSIKQLQISYPYIQWLDLINALLPKDQEVDENEVVNLMAPSFFDELGKLLERTNKRILANYMMWNIYESSLVFLTKALQERQFKYDSFLTSSQMEAMCKYGYLQFFKIILTFTPTFMIKKFQKLFVNFITLVPGTSLHVLVGSLFVRKHFKEESKDIALEIVNNIRDALDQMLDNVKWMDDYTKQQAKKKLHDMKTYIGYPDEMLDSNKLEKYYRDLKIDSEKYFESYLNIKVFEMDKMFEKLRMPADETNRIENFKAADVNAFYSLVQNSIHFPAGILQDTFFNPNIPHYMNYDAIGNVIGHEISHGFFGDGRRFDVNGQLNNWWQPSTEREYIKRARCILKQYGNFTDRQTGLKIKARRSQEENIADIGGIQLSYFAYEKWIAKYGEEEKLLGVNYTPRQMFWISFAQIWCAKYKTETLEQIINLSPHLPSEFRVLGSLQNMKEFSRDFQCPDNTFMNPMNKCVVW